MTNIIKNIHLSPGEVVVYVIIFLIGLAIWRSERKQRGGRGEL